MKTAVEKVQATHKTLYDAVGNNKFTTEQLVKQIGELVSFGKEMKSFYEDLLNTNES